MLKIACLGDGSTHGGIISTTFQDGRFFVGGLLVAVEGDLHTCAIPDSPHQPPTPITSVISRCYYNSKLVLTETAIAGCQALIISPERHVYIGGGSFAGAVDGYEFGFGSSKTLGNIY